MKNFREKLKFWYKRYRRKLIQVYAALLYNANFKGFFTGHIYQGNVKYACVPGLNCYSCPGAAGACPLGALQNALAKSGKGAPYYMIGIVLLFGLLLGRTICGYLCPVGLGQELLYKIKTPKLKKSRYTRILSYLKYFFLAVFVIAIPLMYGLTGSDPVPAFCKYICPAGTFGGGVGILSNPANADQFAQLGPLFTWKFALFAAIVVACVFIFRAFCRFICPLGAIYGFFNKISLIGIKLDKNACTDCGLCVAHCKMDIKHVGDHECINCGECIDVCPAKAISWKGSKLFVHANATADGSAEEPKPLGAMLAVATAETAEPASKSADAPAAAEAQTAPEADANVQSAASVPAAETACAKPPRKKKSAAFWVELTAWIAALILLVGAIVYYNFIDEDKSGQLKVGDVCPDFTLQMYGYDGDDNYTLLDTTYTLSEHVGQVVVINFWATWCGPCVSELPFFNEVQTEYPDVSIVAIQGKADRNVPDFILDEKGWDGYALTFVQDIVTGNTCETYTLLGGTGTWPMTIVLKPDGVVSFIQQGSLPKDTLVAEIEKAGQ